MASPKLNIGFYATPQEMGTWLQEWIRTHNLHFVFSGNRARPAITQDVCWDDTSDVIAHVERYSLLDLNIQPIKVDVPSPSHLALYNTDVFSILLPRLARDGLHYASTGTATRGSEILKVWRSIARDLRTKTAKGVWYSAPRKKKPFLDREARYSEGARQLWEDGVILRGGGDTVVVRLGAKQLQR